MLKRHSRRGVSQYIILYLKGIAMGTADLVPGVSGGTIALITGIYARLLNAIRMAGSRRILQIFKRGGIRKYWREIDGRFLVTLLAGIFTALVLFARIIEYLLHEHPLMIWAFFFGLIMVSIYFIAKRIKRWHLATVLMIVMGVCLGYACSTSVAEAGLPETWPYLMGAGGVAICAMILPGVSGSFLLLLLGKYAIVIRALHEVDLSVLFPVGLGAVLGLIGFSHLLHWFLKRFESPTLGALMGFMVGALVLIWPWRVLISPETTQSRPVLPETYAHQVGDPMIGWVILCCLAGVILVVGLEMVGKQVSARHKRKADQDLEK